MASTTMAGKKSNSMTRLRPEGAEQEALDQQEKLKSAVSTSSLNRGCLPNFTLDLRRRPISALAANSFWSGLSEIKDVLTTGNPLLVPNETAQFYVDHQQEKQVQQDHFFEDINTLYQRQTALFQRSCEQLKDLYQITEQGQDREIDHQADANVSEFVLVETKVKDDSTCSETTSDNTLEGTITTFDVESTLSDEQKIFEKTLKRSKIAFKSRVDILKAVTAGKMVHFQSQNAFGATDLVDVEELYTETIYSLLHMIGNDAPDESMQFGLIEHLRKAFRVEPAKHLLLYEKAVSKDPPQLKLNLCVLEAKDLACKDNLAVQNDSAAKGDPFVTVHLKSRPFEMKHTNCKSRTIHPVWKETFVIDVPEDNEEEVLHVDVWNFRPDENLREKLRKINEVRDSKGLRQFIMDTVTGTSGCGNNNKLIGSVEIPLSSVPASGLNKWWNIEKTPNPKRSRGLIHLLLHLSTNSQKRSTMAAQHRRLLRILLAHELLRNECKPFEWRDQFDNQALHILAQHAVQGRMSRVDTAMSRWLVYAQTHALLPLDLRVFPPILERLRTYLQACTNGSTSSSSESDFMEENLFANDMNEFNMAAEKFSTQCVLFVRKHRYYLGNHFDKYYDQLQALLRCLHILHCLKWRTRGDIVLRVETAVISSVKEWYKFVRNQFAKDLDRKSSESEENLRVDPTDRALSRKMRNLTKLTNLLIADIKTSVQTYRDLFRETLNVDYVELSCKEYEKHLGPLAKNLIGQVCDRLILNQRRLKRRVRHCDETEENIVCVPEFDLVIGTRLFELYLSLQEFYKLIESNIGNNLDGNTTLSSSSSGSQSSVHGDLGPYYTWFLKAVAKWLDIALFKAVQRILKAVEMDDLRHPVDDMVMHTCSAVDIRTVFGQVRTFWTQLAWPDAETAYVFVSRILDDICKASVVYARKLVSKCDDVEAVAPAGGQKQEIGFSKEQCHVVNNLEFVLNAIRPLPQELGVDAIIQRLEDIHGGLVADTCRKTIDVLVKNSVEILENHIMDILEHLTKQMSPKITSFLLEATPTDRSATPIKLLRFLDANLIFLKSFLVPANFSRVLSSVWRISTLSLAKIIEQSIFEKRDTTYFSHLHHVFAVLLNFFYGDEQPPTQQKTGHLNIKRTLKLLQLYSAGPEDLIYNYYSDRFRHQLEQQHPNGSDTSVYPIGSINIRAIVHQTHLRIEVLNCRHLKPLETQKGQKTETSTTKANNGTLRGNFACLSAPEESLLMINKSENQINNISEGVGKKGGLKLGELRSRLDNARQQLIEEAVAVSRSGGMTSTVIGIGSNGMCNPYVSIRLVPDVDGNRFHLRGLKKVKTNVKHRTLFPLFDETFDMVLPEGTDVSKTYVLLSVKDQSPVLGEGLLLGEALLPLADIVKEDGDVSLKDVAQIQLGLSRPNEKNHADLLNAMTVRLASNDYREFLRKERRKMLI